jgi:hypothetical protein|tara:strand:- start:1542 stop:2426 length:885 start_codon:yes stop_codon:yes gene_type:complete
MNNISSVTNETFGQSRAIHPPVDETIKAYLDKRLGHYVESTNENKGTSSERRRIKWERCQDKVRNYLEPLVDLADLKFSYPTNGIHESIDWMCNRVSDYQVFDGEYRYPTFMKRPVNVAKTVSDLKPGISLYMSNPFSATGNFDRRYDEVGSKNICPIYLDLAFAGTTGPYRLNLYDNVQQVFWSCSKPYGLGLLRAGIRFSRREEALQRELMGVGYFNHAVIDVFNEVTSWSSVFAKKEEYKEKQEAICKHLNFLPSDSYLLGLSNDSEWDRFKRENGVNRICLTPAYGVVQE